MNTTSSRQLMERIAISGVEVEVWARMGGVYDAEWQIEKPGEDGERLGSGETLKQAKAQARTKLAKRKVKVEVPFRLLNGRRGIATGIHSGNGNVTVTYPTTGRPGFTDQLQARSKAFCPICRTRRSRRSPTSSETPGR